MEVAVIVKADVPYAPDALEQFAAGMRERLAGTDGLHVQMLFELPTPEEASSLSSTCPPRDPAGR